MKDYIFNTYDDPQLEELMQGHWDSLNANQRVVDEEMIQTVRQNLINYIKEQEVIRESQNKRFIMNKYMMRIASILFLPLLILSSYLFFKLHSSTNLIPDQMVMQDVIASPGSRVHFMLPDETEVWLNSGSSLHFPAHFEGQDKRLVELKGQGYFKVAHDEKHAFIVKTNNLNIKVLGTSFDVSTYDEDKYLVSTLEEGRIAILNSAGNEIAQLKPGEQSSFNKETRELNIKQVETRLSTSWKDGMLIFKNTTLKEVIKQLERWYNCNIQLEDKLDDSEFKLTATIQDETLGEVLQMLEISMDIKTKITNRDVDIWAK